MVEFRDRYAIHHACRSPRSETPSRSWAARPLRTLLGLATGSVNETSGWVVRVEPAMAVPAAHAPEAEAWWRQNLPHLFAGDRTFVFAAACGEAVGAPLAAAPAIGAQRGRIVITAATPTARIVAVLGALLAIDA